jgi:succinate dehydrogenase / fumarate reductase iron-sulfur subunit/fumarate reductase iron-sulfur subunit
MVCPQQIPVEMDITQIEFYGQQKGLIVKKEEGGFGFGQGFGFDMF